MDDKLIDNLIQSDEIISKTIEEGVKSMETSVDDILSSVMSISVGDPQKIEKEAINQAAKEAQNIKDIEVARIAKAEADRLAKEAEEAKEAE